MKKRRKTKRPINYSELKKEFIFANILMCMIGFTTFIYMLLQRVGILMKMPCMVHDWFHIYCMGCGGTRAIFALLQGQVMESLYYNPAVILGGLLILYYEISVLLTIVKKNGKRYYSTSLLPAIFYVVIVMIFTIVRNYLLLAQGIDMLQDFID